MLSCVRTRIHARTRSSWTFVRRLDPKVKIPLLFPIVIDRINWPADYWHFLDNPSISALTRTIKKINFF